MGRMDTLVENVKQLLEFARVGPNEEEWSEKEVKIPRPMLVELAQEVQQYETALPEQTTRTFVQNDPKSKDYGIERRGVGFGFKMPGENN